MTQIAPAHDTHWMQAAVLQAHTAAAAGEVPVGAVVVCNHRIIGSGFNTSIHTHDPSAHAEIMALRAAAHHLGNYRLDDCSLYVTLEPCAMCAGALLHSRLQRVVYGASDPKTGAAGSVLNLFDWPQLNHQTHLQGGVLADICANLLQQFFKRLRDQQQLTKRQAGRALREDALRTPESRFLGLPGWPMPSFYVSDLPSLAGLRLHYLDAGSLFAQQTLLCLHGPNDWCYVWHAQVTQATNQGQRVICPDLIGFGLSDKPKKAAIHQLAWHAQIVGELIERLNLDQFTLQVPHTMQDLAHLVLVGTPRRNMQINITQPGVISEAARMSPYPDDGHQAALKALSHLITEKLISS